MARARRRSQCLYLEGKMLEEVGSAVGLGGLGAGAGIDPHADRRGLGIGRVLSRNLERAARVSGELGEANWSRARAHRQAILECRGLGLDGGRVVRCCEASPERHGKPSSAAAKALGEVQSESPGRHGGGGCGRRGVWK